MLPEVRMARYLDAVMSHRVRRLSNVDAAMQLGVSDRHFRRLLDTYEAEGAEGLIDRRHGRASGRRAPVDEFEWTLNAFTTRYFDFTAKHFHESLLGQMMGGGKPFGRACSWTNNRHFFMLMQNVAATAAR